MGNLVDLFIVKPNKILVDCQTEFDYLRPHIIQMISKPYCELYTYLIKKGLTPEEMLSYYYREQLFQIIDDSDSPTIFEGLMFDRYREDCLQKNLRDVFFYTIVIIENHFDGDKMNQFIVTDGDAINNFKYMTSDPIDQICVENTAFEMVKQGHTVHTPHNRKTTTPLKGGAEVGGSN